MSDENGQVITMQNGRATAPDNPIILYIVGDGIGPDIWQAAMPVFEASIEKAYGGAKRPVWKEILAGEKAHAQTGKWLPDETIEAIKKYKVAIKGPLTTPVGGGIRSLNVTIRQLLDLFACIRPVSHIEGTPAPVSRPELLDVVIFRENTEDVYAGIEWRKGESDTKKVIDFLNNEMGKDVREDSGIGIKPVSEFASKRLVRAAIRYAVELRRKSVTIVHKGNIMKFTEGAFRDWGYEVAREEFGDVTVTEAEVSEKFGGKAPDGKVIIADRIADAMFQQLLLRPDEYDVIATTNLNGDYLSDACAAQVGGLGMAPGANVGDTEAVFEATHGTAPRHAGLDKVNPSSLILSGALMFDFIGWGEAAALVRKGLAAAIREKTVTYDLHRQMMSAKLLKCSEFGLAVAEKIQK